MAAFASGYARELYVEPGIAFSYVAVVVLVLSIFLYMPVWDNFSSEPERAGYPFGPIVICGLIVLVAFMIEATVEIWSALHIERTLHGRAAEGALGPAVLGITMAVGRFSGQAFSQMFTDTKVIIYATLVATSGAVVAALATAPSWAYFGFGILGLGVSVIGPLGLALVGKSVDNHLRTEAISRVALMGFSGFFLAPILMGLVSEFHGLRVAFLSAAVLTLTVIPLALMLRRL